MKMKTEVFFFQNKKHMHKRSQPPQHQQQQQQQQERPKKKRLHVMDCDDLEWFVNILGTDILMKKAVELTTGEKDVNWEVLEKRRVRQDDPNGLYFRSGHWYSKKNGEVTNSYPRSSNYQKDGTAHFCQTFAILLYTKKTRALIPGNYEHNIKTAVKFWYDLFIEYPDFLEMMMDEIHKEYKNDASMCMYNSQTRSKQVRNMTSNDLLRYMENVIANAFFFVGCKEG